MICKVACVHHCLRIRAEVLILHRCCYCCFCCRCHCHRCRVVNDFGSGATQLLGVLLAAVSVVASGSHQVMCGSLQRVYKLQSHQLLAATGTMQVGDTCYLLVGATRTDWFLDAAAVAQALSYLSNTTCMFMRREYCVYVCLCACIVRTYLVGCVHISACLSAVLEMGTALVHVACRTSVSLRTHVCGWVCMYAFVPARVHLCACVRTAASSGASFVAQSNSLPRWVWAHS